MKGATGLLVLLWAGGAAATPAVLQVGTYNGIKGGYTTISAAAAAAQPGDWILVAPGDYKEHGAHGIGVSLTTPGVHLRGMDRNAVIVDGTKAGARACSAAPKDQSAVPPGGRNGIEVYKVDGVSIENLTACNFLSDQNGTGGNEIWWNGGDDSGTVGMGSWYGAYLSATSAFNPRSSGRAGQYGLFVSNARGPGEIEYAFANNMADSAFYIGACADCNGVLNHVRAQNSALGYSGTNSGGHLVLENSEWDHNREGIVPSSLAVSDPPSPQDGACPVDGSKSCMLIMNNFVHDNNNPNTPNSLQGFGPPVGTGIEITGGRNDTVVGNNVTNQGAWGILVNDYPDFSTSNSPQYCQGGYIDFQVPPPYDQLLGATVPCFFPSFGNRVHDNHFKNVGFFGNVTNGDLANLQFPYFYDNCYQNNVDLGGTLTTAPANLQDPNVGGTCGSGWNPDNGQIFTLTEQVLCDAFGPGIGTCDGPGYPLTTGVKMAPLPKQATMPDPCAGVPANSWCSGKRK
jgi:hypothetical protein